VNTLRNPKGHAQQWYSNHTTLPMPLVCLTQEGQRKAQLSYRRLGDFFPDSTSNHHSPEMAISQVN